MSVRRLWTVILVAVMSVALTACGGSRPRRVNRANRVNHCPPAPTVSAEPLASLTAMLGSVPCPATGQAVYDLRDDQGAPMAVLNPIADPAGGYLGVYHTMVRPAPDPGRAGYEILLAHSDDLIHWRRLEVLDRTGAAMPTLRQVPHQPGFLLAYEKAVDPPGAHQIRMAYFRDRARLLSGRPDAAIDLPRLDSYNNGTPAILLIRWHHGLSHSVIMLGFHYQLTGSPHRGQDREAIGVLAGFQRWHAHPDSRIDRLISEAGLAGSHGYMRQFEYQRGQWRVYEASADPGGFATWHIVLYPPSAWSMFPLDFQTAAGTFSSSFGNPTVEQLPAPHGGGRVLVMTMFVFSDGAAAREAGELLFYRPLPG